MKKAVTELRKVYRAGANIFLNSFSVPIEERAYPTEGNLKLDAKIYSTKDLENLFKHIERNAGVSSLSLRDNDLNSERAEIIAHYLGSTRIRKLNLGLNKLGDEGAMIVAGSLSGLRGLDLSFNGIGLLGSKAIFESLRSNPSMRAISLDGNDVTGADPDSFYTSLSRAIAGNSFSRLSFEPISIAPSRRNMEDLNEAAKSNPLLEEVMLRRRVGHPATLGSWHTDPREASADYAPEISVQGLSRLGFAEDAVKDYSTILLVRMIRRIVADNPSAIIEDSDISRFEKAAYYQTQEILFRDMDGDGIKKFSKIWHSPFRQAQSQKLRDFGNESWKRLLGEKKFSVPVNVVKEAGWELVCLENAQELKDEGAKLNHCVGGLLVNAILENHTFFL